MRKKIKELLMPLAQHGFLYTQAQEMIRRDQLQDAVITLTRLKSVIEAAINALEKHLDI